MPAPQHFCTSTFEVHMSMSTQHHSLPDSQIVMLLIKKCPKRKEKIGSRLDEVRKEQIQDDKTEIHYESEVHMHPVFENQSSKCRKIMN